MYFHMSFTKIILIGWILWWPNIQLPDGIYDAYWNDDHTQLKLKSQDSDKCVVAFEFEGQAETYWCDGYNPNQ
jgi:hypothetical protein